MKDKFTPGPWELHDFRSGEHSIFARGKRISGLVATVRYDWPHPDQRYEQIANARLIAAAPDLLEALRKAAAALRCARYSERHLAEECESAIAKATGSK